MSLRVYTGLPASGKTKAIITEMEKRSNEGRQVILILSSEHEELTRRPNVKPGGLMGCRDQARKFPIDYVIDTNAASELLLTTSPGTLVVFDEAQYFQPTIVADWHAAAQRGVDITVGTPSPAQVAILKSLPHESIELTVNCQCGNNVATRAVYTSDLVYPNHLCEGCYEEHMQTQISNLLDLVHKSKPFPGDLHTYQPFYDLDMSGWELVRSDCPARLSIIQDSASRCDAIRSKLEDHVAQPSFIDLGCCSGFFADGMASSGFRAAGVDVSEDFISWASQLAHIKGQAINYRQQDLLSYLTETDGHFDIISTFATVQWVMAQQGYEAGVKCFHRIFEMADQLCVIEMGYTSEEIYHDKIADRPSEIDRTWMIDLMESSGLFHTVELHPSGENGIWRDIFVGFKNAPNAERTFDDFPQIGARQSSNVSGYWTDDWVSTALAGHFQANQPLSHLHLEGWRPDNAPDCSITVTINGELLSSREIETGLFEITAPLRIEDGAYFDLQIATSESLKADDDERSLAFVLRNLTFS